MHRQAREFAPNHGSSRKPGRLTRNHPRLAPFERKGPQGNATMRYAQGKPHALREAFWRALADSPFVMLQLDADADSAAPMTASLDEDADHAIWFFTARDNRFARLGSATATFAAKGHELFARFHGVLSEETDRARLDKQWSNFVEAWVPGGKDDPNLLFLRLNLGDAAIWSGELGALATAKMALGMSVKDEVAGKHVETAL